MFMVILVTGCTGFIGGACIRELRRRFPHAKVIGVDDLSAGTRANIPDGTVFFEASITDQGAMEAIVAAHRPECIFHFAALPRVAFSLREPVLTAQVNILGTAVLLELAHIYGAKRFIFSSSSAVYGSNVALPTNENARCFPASPYAVHKLAGEEMCRMYSRTKGLDSVCLRYFNVYGPGQRGSDPYSTVIAAWLEGSVFANTVKPYIEGDGTQTRDFCFVEDVVEANILSMLHDGPLAGEALNIASGEAVSLQSIRASLEHALHRSIELEQRPPRIGDVAHTRADVSRAKKVLGFSSRVPLEEGIQKTVAWFASLAT